MRIMYSAHTLLYTHRYIDIVRTVNIIMRDQIQETPTFG